ncbi:hypothetical protein vseg_008985 [Gypsophila vaccaria]
MPTFPLHHPISLPSLPLSHPTFPISKPLSARPHRLSATLTPDGNDEDDFRVLTATRTEYNNIIILETHNSKVLLLDDSRNVHSILYEGNQWTYSYWDEFTTLPAVLPPGPIAVFGLGGGTIANQLLNFWPTLHLHGWELDEILVDRARQFFSLSELETENASGGVLHVHVGDALSPTASVPDGYAGIVVDLFSNAKVLPELERADTWLEMKQKLRPNGRIMVNCGGDGDVSSLGRQGGWEGNATIRAMCEAFGRDLVKWKKMPENESGNYLAFTGTMPDVESWSNKVPHKLTPSVSLWRPCDL